MHLPDCYVGRQGRSVVDSQLAAASMVQTDSGCTQHAILAVQNQ